MGNASLGTLIGMLVALPFVAFADWFKFIKQMPPGEQELAKACHGVGMLSLLALWFSMAGGLGSFLYGLVAHPDNLIAWIPVGIAAWGFGWFVINSPFAVQAVARPARATMTVRAMLKIGVGYAAWAYAQSGDLVAWHRDPSWWSGFVRLALYVIAVWCLATGLTKLVLMLWGGRRGKARPMVDADIAGKEFNWDDDGSIR